MADGFDPIVTVISQYANSTVLLKLIDNFFQYVDQTADMDAFYNLIWNVDTAQGYGLDVWGRIVGVSRTLHVASGKFFGYVEAGTLSADPFNQSPFWIGAGSTTNYDLSDTAYRQLIFAKALSNISDGSIPSINQLLINLFGDSGNAYVADLGNMTMAYTFMFSLTPVQQAIIDQSGVLPKPTGVGTSSVVIIPVPFNQFLWPTPSAAFYSTRSRAPYQSYIKPNARLPT